MLYIHSFLFKISVCTPPQHIPNALLSQINTKSLIFCAVIHLSDDNSSISAHNHNSPLVGSQGYARVPGPVLLIALGTGK